MSHAPAAMQRELESELDASKALRRQAEAALRRQAAATEELGEQEALTAEEKAKQQALAVRLAREAATASALASQLRGDALLLVVLARDARVLHAQRVALLHVGPELLVEGLVVGQRRGL